jgi:hypothetical protein
MVSCRSILVAFTHKASSVGPLPSDEVTSANPDNAEMEVQATGNEGGNGEDDHSAHGSADGLSVMFSPCQDPLLVKIYRGLPVLPCVASIPCYKVC